MDYFDNMETMLKSSRIIVPMKDLPRATRFPLRAESVGYLKDNWHDDARPTRGIICGLTLSSRDGMAHRLINGTEMRMRCPTVGFLRPGDCWRNLSPAPWDELYIAYPPESAEVLERLGVIFAKHQEIAISPSLTDMLHFLLRLMEHPHEPGNSDRIDCAAYQLIMGCQIAAIAPPSDDPTEKIVREAASWIRLHCRERLKLETFLRGKGITYRTFMRKWHAMFDKSPSQYALDLKIEEAKRLLRETGLTVEAVADQLQIEDALYFSRLFRRREGVSPRQFRNSLLENRQNPCGKTV